MPLKDLVPEDWRNVLADEFEKPYFLSLESTLREEYRTKRVYPKARELFKALELTPYANVKAVILGQDPYHNDHQAHGLSFSVNPQMPAPPSLQNIFKELYDDTGIRPSSPCLENWARQGVLLLNSVLSVLRNQPTSHRALGWQTFTDEIIRKVNEKDTPVVFILWGNYAKEKARLLTNPLHLVLKSAHPSPFSASYGFFGSRPFSKTNAFLTAHNETPIDWRT